MPFSGESVPHPIQSQTGIRGEAGQAGVNHFRRRRTSARRVERARRVGVSVAPWALCILLAYLCILAYSAGPSVAWAKEGAEDFQRELSRGLVLLELGQHQEALTSLRRASRMKPDRIDLRLRIAALEARTGEDGLAEKHLRQLLEKDPEQGDALRELGALLIARNRPAEAEPMLARAVTQRTKDGLGHFYLGLAQHALDKDTAARDSFKSAAEHMPSLASQAHYQAALNHLRAGETKEARARLLAAVSAKSDDASVRKATNALEEIDRREAVGGKRWDLSLTVGAAFDSNVSLLPDLAGDLPLPPGTNLIDSGTAVTTAAAARLSTEIAFEVRPIMGAHTLGIGAGLYQSKHIPENVLSAFAPPQFDQSAMAIYLFYAFAGRISTLPFRAELAGGLVESLLDTFRVTRHFLETPWLRPSFSMSFAKWASARLSYRFAGQNFVTGNLEGSSDDRDGFEHLFTLETFLSAGRFLDFRVAFTAGVFGADGDQWDTVFLGAAADLRVRVHTNLDLFVGIDYLRRDFIHSIYAVAGRDLSTTREVARIDDRLSAFARVRLGGEHFSVALFYNFITNASSAAALFGYARHVAGLELGLNY